VVYRFKFYLLQIQDDVGYVLNDPREGSKLVLRPSNPNGNNSSSFQRRQKNSAQRVANGVAIPCLKRFGDEFGVALASSLVRLFGISKRPKRAGICTCFNLCRVPPLARAVAGQTAETHGPTAISDARIRRLFGLREDHDGAVVTAGVSIQLRLNSNKCTLTRPSLKYVVSYVKQNSEQ
jgi:hypothetical protein